MNKKHKIWQSHIPGHAIGAEVVNTKFKDRKTGKTEVVPDIGFAIRFWKRAVKDSGILEEYKERRFHTKKSEKRRVALERAKFWQYVRDQEE